VRARQSRRATRAARGAGATSVPRGGFVEVPRPARLQAKGNVVTKRILVVDDRADLLELLRRVLELEDEAYKVSVLRQGDGAVDQIRENQPDLVILDLKLADANGMDILQELRASSSTADIPVIVYTAAVIEAETVARLISGNPARYSNVTVLQKPFELDALLERVQLVLGAAQST
jgi:DNA-binding response OmpR family regulator